ncbi:transglutaminaseTgpA domain-containing protein [Caminibacter mediatlanticus]|nr:DUF3488 and transglutaminase-like domain-containing protein [Caminibacter mediatlanticus]
MKYLKNLLYIDLALFISLLPVFFVLPTFIQIFIIVGVVLIILNKPFMKFVAILGIVSLVLSFYKAIYDIGVFKTYIMFLISFLSYGVILQRLKREINFWLIISPLLFLLLSLVIYQNIYMLFFTILEIFIFIFVVINYSIKNSIISFKESIKIFFISIPIVVLLFIFFPRFFMLKSNFGFKSNYVLSGFSGEMKVSDKNVINSDQIVLETKFDKNPTSLYFRGSVLYKNLGNVWIEVDNVVRDKLEKCIKKISYRIKEFPTNQKYVFALDIPITHIPNSYITTYFTIKTFKNIKKSINAKITSCEEYILKNNLVPLVALEYNKKYNLKTQQLIKNIRKIKDDEKRLKAIEELFISQKIIYTLTPPKMDTLNIVDSLFEKKRGYCVHFASAFATLSRMVGIPSRVVTGFLGKKENMYKNFLVIRAKDSHAWVEVYLKNKGWIRIDPTIFAYKEIKTTNKKDIKKENIVENKVKPLSKEMLYLMYIRFTIEEWVLNYNFFKQQRLLKYLQNKEFLLKAISIFLVFVFLVILVVYLTNKKKIDIEDKLIEKLLRVLEKDKKRGHQTIYAYLKSFNDNKLDKINIIYNKLKFYKKSQKDIKTLIRLINEYLKSK